MSLPTKMLNNIEARRSGGTFTNADLRRWYERLLCHQLNGEVTSSEYEHLQDFLVWVLRAMSANFPIRMMSVADLTGDRPAANNDPMRVAKYSDLLDESDPPPLVVREYIVLDGNHRLAAARRKGVKRIATVRPWG